MINKSKEKQYEDLISKAIDIFSSPERLAGYLKNLKDPSLIEDLSFYGREIMHLSKNNYLFDAKSKAFVK